MGGVDNYCVFLQYLALGETIPCENLNSPSARTAPSCAKAERLAVRVTAR